jgi:subtilisin family serine protease
MANMEKYIILKSPLVSVAEFGPSIKGIGATPTGHFSVTTAELTKKEIQDLRINPDVHLAVPEMRIKLVEPVAREINMPAEKNETWGVSAVGALQSPCTGKGVTVAVLDTGIDAGHAAFSGMKIEQKDFTGEGDGDKHGHGTHCAGTIFGKPVDGLRIGLAPGIDRALIGKVLKADGSGSTEAIVRAMEWALDLGANVISVSLGIDFTAYVDGLVKNGFPIAVATSKGLEAYRGSIMLFATLASLAKNQGQGTLIVAASGNESRRNENPEWDIAASPPAAAEGIYAVGALEKSAVGLRVPWFSNTKVDIAAPGVDVTSARAGGGLTAMSGTSMAAPHVAGVAALWAEKLLATPGLKTTALASKVLASGIYDPLARPSDALDVGTGIVQAPQN